MKSPTARASELRTPICDLLGITYPVVQAGMAGSSTPDLVASVSNAGGLGILGAAMMTPSQVREAVRAIKARTDRPFGVNFQFARPEVGPHSVREVQQFLDRFRRELGLPPAADSLPPAPGEWNAQIGVVLEEHVPVFWSAPWRWCRRSSMRSLSPCSRLEASWMGEAW